MDRMIHTVCPRGCLCARPSLVLERRSNGVDCPKWTTSRESCSPKNGQHESAMHPRIPLSRCAGRSRPTHNYQTLEGTPTATSSYKACLASVGPPSPATGLILERGGCCPPLCARDGSRDPAPRHRYRPRLALPSILSLSLSPSSSWKKETKRKVPTRCN